MYQSGRGEDDIVARVKAAAVACRPASRPGDAAKALAVSRSGRTVVGDAAGDPAWIAAGPYPDGATHMAVAERDGVVVAYAVYRAVGVRTIPALEVVSVVVAPGVPAVPVGRQLLGWVTRTFWATTGNRGWVAVGARSWVAAHMLTTGGWTRLQPAAYCGADRFVKFAPEPADAEG